MIRSTRFRQAVKGSGWLMTFADLMTLLLTFFILLLSFSNIDAQKYRMIANSMAVSFGVSWIQGSPPPLIIEVPVEVPAPDVSPPDPPELPPAVSPTPTTNIAGPAAGSEQIDELASRLIEDLTPEIANDALSVQYDQEKVVVRFSQDATFPIGSAELKTGMDRIVAKVVDSLSRCDGRIIVAGYTDDQPISSPRFRSNWDLSAARAVSVVHELLKPGVLNPETVMAAGHADTRALEANETPEGRSRNRRVEINVYNPVCTE